MKKSFREYLDSYSSIGDELFDEEAILGFYRCEKEMEVDFDYYFAYGSNLNLSQMKDRCKGSEYISNYKLEGYQLVFRGVADVVGSPRNLVVGGLFKVNGKDLAELDKYEGCPTLYDRVYILDEFFGTIMFYQMQKRKFNFPTASYFECLVKGYNDCGLPKRKLNEALRCTTREINRHAASKQKIA